MTIKQQINHGTIEKVCHLHNGIYYPFTQVTLCQFYSFTFPVKGFSSLKIRNYGMREKKIFCIIGCFSVSRYIKGGRKSYL